MPGGWEERQQKRRGWVSDLPLSKGEFNPFGDLWLRIPASGVDSPFERTGNDY